MSSDFFRVENGCQIISFRLSEIIAIESPKWPNKPAGWLDEYAAAVFLQHRPDPIMITSDQFAQLKDRMERKDKSKGDEICHL